MQKALFVLRRSAPAKLLSAASLLSCLSLTACGDDVLFSQSTGTDGSSSTATQSTGNANSSSPSTLPGTSGATSTTPSSDSSTTSSSSSSSTDTSGEPKALTLEDLVAEACGWGARCCDDNEFAYIYGTDAASCTNEVMGSIVGRGPNRAGGRNMGLASAFLVDLVTRVDLERSKLWPKAAQACHDYLKNRACLGPDDGNESCNPQAHNNPCDLEKIFIGQVPMNKSCNPDVGDRLQCAPGSTCQPYPQAPAMARCVKEQDTGTPCFVRPGDPQSNCKPGNYCSLETGNCTALPGAGESCAFKDSAMPLQGTATIPCQPGLSCSAKSLTCVTRCSEETRCGVTVDGNERAIEGADKNLCGDALSCVPTLVVDKEETALDQDIYVFSCQEPRPTNGLCDTDHDCAYHGWCDRADNAAVGVCKDILASGVEGCEDKDERCVPGYYCSNNRCVAKIKAGSLATCTSHRQCEDDAVGCVGLTPETRRCIADKLPIDAACVPDYGINSLPAAEFERLVTKSGKVVPGASDFSYWGNYCASNVCELGLCSDGAKLGETCGQDPNNINAPICAFGLQCLSGVCQPLLGSGAPCEPESAPDIAACHFDLEGGLGNENSCTQVDGTFRCGLRIRDERGSYCDGK